MVNEYFDRRMDCPACGEGETGEIYARAYMEEPIRGYLENFYASCGGVEFEYLTGARFILRECSGCGLVFQEEVPNDFLMNKLYEEWIDPKTALEQHAKKFGLAKASYYAREIAMVMGYLGRPASELEVLDFGMGWGRWCLMAKAFGCRVFGSDLSKERVEFARSLGIAVLSPDELSGRRFDFINTEQVFEHVPYPLDTLKLLKKSMKPGGLIKINVPDGREIKRLLAIDDWSAPKNSKNSLNMVSPMEHINCFTRDSVIRMASLANLKPVEIPESLKLIPATTRSTLRQLAKNLARRTPIVNRLFNRGAYLFFTGE